MTSFTNFTLNYIVNAFWQAPLVFAAAWLAARICRRLGPAVQHHIWCVALLLQVLLPACVIHAEPLFGAMERIFGHASTAPNANITITAGAAYARSTFHLSPGIIAAVFIAYACVTAYFVLRLACGLWQTHTIRRNAHPLTPNLPIQIEWQRIRNCFHLQHAHIATSTTIVGPITIGIAHRLLLLPESYLHAVSHADAAAAIAHECAHMRRRDFAKNLIYEIIALPLAWYLPLRLTRAHLAETREMLCDDLAATALTGRHEYAYSLLRLASVFSQSNQRPSLHAIGIFDANNLDRRITHMTRQHTSTRTARKLMLAASTLALGLGTCAFALTLHTNIAVSAMQADVSQASSPSNKVPGHVMAGQILYKVDPIYPPAAKAAKIQGIVVVQAVIGKDGAVEKVRAVSGPQELMASAVDAVRQWKFRPYMHDGKPTKVETHISVNYALIK